MCDRCRQKTGASNTASAPGGFLSQFKSIPNGVGLVVISGILEVVAIGAMLFGAHSADSPATQDAGLLVFFGGCVLSVVSAIVFMLGILRWSIGPFIEVLVRQNDHLIGLLKSGKR
jgi:hypothetical protein